MTTAISNTSSSLCGLDYGTPSGGTKTVIDYLRRVDIELDGGIDEVRDIRLGLMLTEEALARVNRRLDRFELRFDHFERRPDLTDAPC